MGVKAEETGGCFSQLRASKGLAWMAGWGTLPGTHLVPGRRVSLHPHLPQLASAVALSSGREASCSFLHKLSQAERESVKMRLPLPSWNAGQRQVFHSAPLLFHSFAHTED